MSGDLTSIFEMRDADGRLYFDAEELEGEVTDEPAPVTEVIRRMGGDALSGAQRAAMTLMVESSIARFFEAARTLTDEEFATALLLRVIAHDETFRPAPWLVVLLRQHRDACARTLWGPDRCDRPEPNHDIYGDGRRKEDGHGRAKAETADDAAVRELARELSVDARDVLSYFDNRRNRTHPLMKNAVAARSRSEPATVPARCA